MQTMLALALVVVFPLTAVAADRMAVVAEGRTVVVAADRTVVVAADRVAVAAAGRMVAADADSAKGKALVERLRRGGLTLFFRHADTRGMPCDRSFRIGDREGQRNLSAEGRAQAQRIGERLQELSIPFAFPVLAGPVYRARDTAELAFGREQVQVTESLLADDYAGSRLQWVLAEHERLFSARVPPGVDRVLVGHRTPAIMVLGRDIGGDAFPEGAALVIAPSQAGEAPRVLGILMLAPLPGGGFHAC